MDEPPEGVAEAINKAAAELRRLEHVPAAHADLYERVALAQQRTRARLQPPLYPPPTPETARQMLGHGFFLIDFERLRIEPARLEALWLELAAILAEFGELSEARAERLRALAAAGRLPLAELAAAVFKGDLEGLGRLARRVRLPARLLAWISALALKPFLAAAAQELAGLLKGAAWPQACCPVCGHEPLMAFTRREGAAREAECSLCATRWEVRRGRCLFCGNEDKATYKFLAYDLEGPYRVDVCDKCHRYLKVADERKIPLGTQLPPVALDIATLYLDQLARRKGYLPPWSRMPGGKTKKERQTEEVVPA